MTQRDDKNAELITEISETLERMNDTGYGAMHGDLLRRCLVEISAPSHVAMPSRDDSLEEAALAVDKLVIDRKAGDNRDPEDELFFEFCDAAAKKIRGLIAAPSTGAAPSGETPRTDAFLRKGDAERVVRCSYTDLERLVLEVADFARQLERELAEEREAHGVLKAAHYDATEGISAELARSSIAEPSDEAAILSLAESMANKQQINGWYEKVGQILGREVVRLSARSARAPMRPAVARVLAAAMKLSPLLEEGWDDQDTVEDQDEGSKACDELVAAVNALGGAPDGSTAS